MTYLTEDNMVARQTLEENFLEAEREKSNLILEANLLKAQGQHQSAADCFAQAAQIEEQLGETLYQKGLMRKFFVHRFSALSCWAQAGNVYQAIAMGETLLTRDDLPDSLREPLQTYIQLIRARMEHWIIQFAPELHNQELAALVE